MELQRSLGSSVGQTLSGEPGMATRFNGPVANAPVICGLTGERVLVLVRQDGDRAGDLSSAAVDHLNAVDPSAVERLEVIRGPASLLYGNNALGGVVNVPQLQFGARVDHFALKTIPQNAEEIVRFGPSNTSNFSNVSGSLGLSVPLKATTSFSASLARGFRAPTVEELYANGFHAVVGTFDIGNPNLKPEQSTGLEAGLRPQSGKTFAQFNTYYNLISNYVLPRAIGHTVANDDSVPLVNYFQGDARMYEVEGQAETELVSHVVGGIMGDFTRATLKSGGNLPYIPAGRIGGSLRYDNGRMSLGGDFKRVLSQTKVSGDQLDVITNAYTLVNVSASWIFSGKTSTVNSLTVRTDNLLDPEYRDAASRIKSFAFNPGRNVSVIYKVLF